MVEALTVQVQGLAGDKQVLTDQVNSLLSRKQPAKGADAASALSHHASFPQNPPDPAALMQMLQSAQDRGEQKTLTMIREVGNLFKSFHESYVDGLAAGDKIRKAAVEDYVSMMEEQGADDEGDGLGDAVEGARQVVGMFDELRAKGKGNGGTLATDES